MGNDSRFPTKHKPKKEFCPKKLELDQTYSLNREIQHLTEI